MQSYKMDEELDDDVLLGYGEACTKSHVRLELRELRKWGSVWREGGVFVVMTR